MSLGHLGQHRNGTLQLMPGGRFFGCRVPVVPLHLRGIDLQRSTFVSFAVSQIYR